MDILIGLIALFHVYVFVLEALLWQTPAGLKAFNTTATFAAESRSLAINQGVYNLFLAAGLGWSLLAEEPFDFRLKLFFLGCVVVAAVTAGMVVSKRIMLIQGTPAVIALLLVIMTH